MLTKEDRKEIQAIVERVLSNPAGHVAVACPSVDALVAVTARAIEVLGTREKALRWLQAPVRSLQDQTPLSLLNTAEGLALVEDALGRIEHGVW